VTHAKCMAKSRKLKPYVLDLLFAVEAHKGLNFDQDMNQTVVQLGLQDKVPFLEIEEHATLEQLMMSRSGIYIPTGNRDQEKILPKRGSAYPGTRFFYNNWDFYAAGIAFEKLTHKDIFDALRDDLAIPLRFQDFDRARQKKNYGTTTNQFEYATYLSTRDMARLGLLALRNGAWGNTVWGDPGLIEFSTYPTTHFNEIGDWYWSPGWTGRWGYGILWWAWDAPKYPGDIMTGPYQGAFSAIGANGQYITVFPLNDIVVAHKVNIDIDESRAVSGPTYMTILDMVLDAECGDSADKSSRRKLRRSSRFLRMRTKASIPVFCKTSLWGMWRAIAASRNSPWSASNSAAPVFCGPAISALFTGRLPELPLGYRETVGQTLLVVLAAEPRPLDERDAVKRGQAPESQ
jgi:Beta-lactamase